MAERQKLLVLDDTVLLSISNRGDVTSAYPIFQLLKNATAGKGKCGPCSRKAAQRGNVFGQVKAAIATLTDADKIKLKELLDTTHLRLRYNRAGDGRLIELTF